MSWGLFEFFLDLTSQVVQTILEDQLVQFQFSHDLLQPDVFFLQATQFRQLRLAHATEPAPSFVIGRVADTDTTTGRPHILAICQLQFNLTQPLQNIFVRVSLPSHLLFPFLGKIVAQF